MQFRWNDWNLEHVTKHSVDPLEAEKVVFTATKPYLLKREDEKWLAGHQSGFGGSGGDVMK